MHSHHERLQRKIEALENQDRTQKLPADQLLDRLHIKPAANILDLGAGTGYLTLPVADRTAGTVYALDRDENILAYLSQKAKEQNHHNITPITGDFTSIPLGDETVDTTLASISLHETQQLPDVLKEIHRVLQNDGQFLCLELEHTSSSSGPRVSSEQMSSAIMAAGFEIVEQLPLDFRMGGDPAYLIIARR
ncbi:SAM-dependent methyltransferase [Geomicrobium sp. JCM 19037]|uniref:class I SAM-dependent methyltransferase n=1 Tax=unclassified Geomicrobium TaxID=2628951 RepID=UPI00045F2528|nr:methyltransferase domain-containing protein [Geomicrobium sp. JCM 19037]GAK04000.1 SAM-dependent methyltransferase [Geomicrobium sp. JCM 19037]